MGAPAPNMMRLAGLVIALSALVGTDALLQPQVGRTLMRAPAARRASTLTMGEASTKKANEWKYVKGINDYGKEQTYMYLGAKDDAAEDSAPLSKPLIDLGDWSFLLKPYFVILFTPSAL